MCRCPLGAGAAAGAAPGAPRARGEPEGTDRHTDILTPTTKADSPRPVPSLPLSPSQRVLPHSPICAPGHQRPLPAPTASRGALRAPVLCAPAASGAPAAPSALARQPSSRRLIAPRGSDVSPGTGQSQAPIQIPAPLPALHTTLPYNGLGVHGFPSRRAGQCPLCPRKRRAAGGCAPSGLSSKLLCFPLSPRKPGSHCEPSELGSSGDEVWDARGGAWRRSLQGCRVRTWEVKSRE